MPIQLVVTLDETGQVGVSGPIQNQMLCFGLLEMAKIAINDHAKQNQQLVKPVHGILAPQMPGQAPKP